MKERVQLTSLQRINKYRNMVSLIMAMEIPPHHIHMPSSYHFQWWVAAFNQPCNPRPQGRCHAIQSEMEMSIKSSNIILLLHCHHPYMWTTYERKNRPYVFDCLAKFEICTWHWGKAKGMAWNTNMRSVVTFLDAKEVVSSDTRVCGYHAHVVRVQRCIMWRTWGTPMFPQLVLPCSQSWLRILWHCRF
jgi:hypothetical protein